ncbi:MAG: DUF2007 domain-containing protein [Terricaulis sp.]
MADLLVAALFLERSEAIVAHGLLESEGVYAVMPDFNVMSVEPGFAFTQGGFRLLVRADEVDRARAILRDAQVASAEAGNVAE